MGRKLIFLVCIFIVLILSVSFPDTYCSAINKSDCVESTDRTFEDCFHKSESMFEDMPVGNFDVSDSGKLLLCLQHNSINIYDNQGKFECALSYDIGGSSRAFWQGESIVIYLVRENTFVLLDENFNVNKIYEYIGNDASELVIDLDNTKEITHEGVSYNLSGVKKLTRTDSEGEKIIYLYKGYDIIILLLYIVGISCIIIIYSVKYGKKNPYSL